MNQSSSPDQNWYTVREVFPHIWSIGDRGVNCYLVVGSERAMLIDAGWGFGNLADLVSQLTTAPLSLINTHGHRDHTSGDYQFPSAMIHPTDALMIPDAELRRQTLERFASGPYPPGFDAEQWVNAPAPVLQPMPEDGEVIDLGFQFLRVIYTPGHTPGSVCLLESNSGALFTGDTVVDAPILMFLPHSLTLSTYAASLERLLAFRKDITAVLPGHGGQLSSDIIDELHQGALAIINGEVTGELTQHFLGNSHCAQFPHCKICYDPARLK